MTIAPSATAPAADGLLAALDAEQRAAATLPGGPAQVIAPAGSGKTTTLIARLGVLLGRGVAADRIGVVTFNRDAAAELSATFHMSPTSRKISIARTRIGMAPAGLSRTTSRNAMLLQKSAVRRRSPAPEVVVLAAIGAGQRTDVGRPAPARLHPHPTDDDVVGLEDLDAGQRFEPGPRPETRCSCAAGVASD